MGVLSLLGLFARFPRLTAFLLFVPNTRVLTIAHVVTAITTLHVIGTGCCTCYAMLQSILSEGSHVLCWALFLGSDVSAGWPLVGTSVVVLHRAVVDVSYIVTQVPKPGALDTSVVRQLLCVGTKAILKMLWVVDASDANIAPTALEHKGSSMTSMMQGNDVALPQSITALWAGHALHGAPRLWTSLVAPYPVCDIILEAITAKAV